MKNKEKRRDIRKFRNVKNATERKISNKRGREQNQPLNGEKCLFHLCEHRYSFFYLGTEQKPRITVTIICILENIEQKIRNKEKIVSLFIIWHYMNLLNEKKKNRKSTSFFNLNFLNITIIYMYDLFN